MAGEGFVSVCSRPDVVSPVALSRQCILASVGKLARVDAALLGDVANVAHGEVEEAEDGPSLPAHGDAPLRPRARTAQRVAVAPE